MTAENGRREYLSQAGPQRCLSCLSGKMPTARDFVAHWIIKYASNKQIVRLIDRIEWFILRPLLRFVRLKRMDAALDESLRNHCFLSGASSLDHSLTCPITHYMFPSLFHHLFSGSFPR